MSTQAGVGISQHHNPKVAGQTAVANALEQADITQPDFVFLFATVGYRQEILVKTVRAATGNAPLYGCSAAGIIAQGLADESNFAVAVMVVRSDELRFYHGALTGLSQSSTAVGQELGRRISQANGADAIALFLNADAITVNFDDLMTGLGQTNQQPLPIIGSLCGDNFAYQKTYQYHNEQVISDGISWALLSGNADLVTGISHGCVAVGQKRTITRAKGNKIYEIDHQPVLDVLHDYLEDDEIESWDRTAVNLGLGLVIPGLAGYGADYGGDVFIRCMMSKDEATGSVAMATNINEGSDFWVTRRDTEKMKQAAKQTAFNVLNRLNGKTPKFVLHIECDGRGKMVLPETDKQAMIAIMQETIGRDIPWIGLYAYGEVCPIKDHNCLHGFAGVLSVVC